MINGELIKEKARTFANKLNLGENSPEFSNGWLQKFQQRHGFKQFKFHGESSSVNLSLLEEQPKIVKKLKEFRLQDIYNMDETELFYRMAPDHTIAQHQISGLKKDRIRLTIAFTANADGTHKLEPFIGKA